MKNKWELRLRGEVIKAGTRQDCVAELCDISESTGLSKYFLMTKAHYELVDLQLEREELGLTKMYAQLYFCLLIPVLGAWVLGVTLNTLRYDKQENLIRLVFIYQVIVIALLIKFCSNG